MLAAPGQTSTNTDITITMFYYSTALEQKFKAMDKDGNGSLTKEELSDGLAAQGFEKEVADIILEELEFDGDGKYSIKEFLETVAFSEQFAATYRF